MILKIVATVQLKAVDRAKAVDHPLHQLHFVLAYAVHAVLLEPLLSGPQCSDADEIWGSVFQPPRVLLEVIRMSGAHPSSSAAHQLHPDVLANAQATDPHAAHQRLMPGKRHNIDVHRAHV